MEKQVIIIGAGLVGSLWAVYMAKRGYKVTVYERRSDVRKAEKPRDDDRQFGGYNEDYFKKHQHRITKAFHYVGIKGFDLENLNLVIDNILETKSWVDNKNRACNKLTGNIVKDFRPPIAGETDYQFVMEAN